MKGQAVDEINALAGTKDYGLWFKYVQKMWAMVKWEQPMFKYIHM